MSARASQTLPVVPATRQHEPPRAASNSPRNGVLQRKCSCGGPPGPTGECEECRKKKLQRKAQSPALGAQNDFSVPPIVQDVLRMPGQPLDLSTRAFMEPRFGHDFSQVRVHADTRAAESAESVHALAYTVGRDIVFGANNFAPSTHHGRELLGHELAHTIQQQNLSGASSPAASEMLESNADASGRAIASGQSVSPHFPACGVGLARQLATPTVYNDQDLAQAIQKTSERLKQASYPGRDGDLDWMRQLQSEAARRTKLNPPPAAAPSKPAAPPKPPPPDPAAERAAAVKEAEAAAAQMDQDSKADGEEDEPVVTPMAISGQKYEAKPAAKTPAKHPQRKKPDPAMAKFLPGGFTDEDIYKESNEAMKRFDEQIAKEREMSKIPYKARLYKARSAAGAMADETDFRKLTADQVWNAGLDMGYFAEFEKPAVLDDQNEFQQKAREKREDEAKYARAKFESDKERAWEAHGDQMAAPQGIIQPFVVAAAAPELVAAAYFGTQSGAMVGDMVNACRDGSPADCAAATAKVVAAVAAERALKGKTAESPKTPPPDNPDLTFPRGTDVTNRSAFPPGGEPLPSPGPRPADATTPNATSPPDINATYKSLGITTEEAAQFPSGAKIWGETVRGGSKLVTYFKLQGGKLTAGVLSAELPKIKGMTPAQVAAAEQSNVIKAFLGFRQQSMSLAKQLGANTLRVEADVVVNEDLPESLTKAGFQPIPDSPGSFFKEEPVK